jgi:23S rRNA (guanosine2251-2'-O)-methyltransferase
LILHCCDHLHLQQLQASKAASMERHGRGKGKKKLLGSHQKCWIWGRNPVIETLVAGRWEILELLLSGDLEAGLQQTVRCMAEKQGVPLRIEPADSLERLCHTTEHQGFLARMTEFPYAVESEVLKALSSASFSVILDGIQDPYNFGAIIRSAEVFGADAIFIPRTGQVGVTSMVARSSVGAVNRVPIVRAETLEGTVLALKGAGVAVVAASEKASMSIAGYDFRRSAAIIVGNEGKGVSPELTALCDVTVRIPQVGKIGSLNAAVAAGIFFYEVGRQRSGQSVGPD